MIFTKKTIWITGAASGIGKAVAINLSKLDTNLILSDIDEKGLEIVAGTCESNNSKTFIVPINLGDENSVNNAIKKVLAKETKIDCLYQFAGISQRSFVNETPLEIDRKIFEINFFGTLS